MLLYKKLLLMTFGTTVVYAVVSVKKSVILDLSFYTR